MRVERVPLAVIGAGPAGLALARTLQVAGKDVVVFEGEASANARSQGGTLDLHAESGQWALEQAGLTAEFRALARPEGQAMRIGDKTGKLLWDEAGGDGMERPEIDREQLRRLLLDSLRPGTIRWGHTLDTVQRDEGQGLRLEFRGGVAVEADVVLGADGTWSRIRPLLTDAKPSYTGVSFLQLAISDAEARHPEIVKTVGSGTLFALQDNKGLIAQRLSNGSIRVYVALRMRENGFEAEGIPLRDGNETRDGLLAHFKDWSANLQDLIKHCDDFFVPWPITAMPVGIRWPSQPCVTLLGDAAHQMSPFAGAGANLALQDGAALALKLCRSEDAEQAIRAYEAEMFERAAEEAKASADGLEVCVAPNGAERFRKQMQDVQGLR